MRSGLRGCAWLAGIALVLTACPAGEREPEPTPPPIPGGAIRFGYPAEPPTFDPTGPGGGSAATRDLLRPVLPALFRLDSELRPTPELVRAWPAEEAFELDPFSVELELRRASWSDGTAISAEDVRFTWERLREGPTGARYRFLTDVEVLGPRDLRLHFDRPVRRWWALFSLDDMVLPAHAPPEEWDTGPTVSGGPFAFEEHVPGRRVRLRRNDAYWADEAHLERIDVLFVPDDETRLELLERGELDALFASGAGDVGFRAAYRGFGEAAREPGEGGAVGVWGSTWWELAFHHARFEGRGELAAAAAAAIDRTLVAELLGDSAQAMDGIPARFPVPPPEREGEPAVAGPWPPGDLDRASHILEDAGYSWSDGELQPPAGEETAFSLAYPRGSGTATGIARLIHFALAELGVHVELVRVEEPAFEASWIPEGRADAYLVRRRGADAPDPSPYRPDAAPPGRTPGIGDTLDLAASAVGLERLTRRPIAGLGEGAWAEAQEEIRASATAVPLVRVRTWIVARPAVVGARPLGGAAGPFWDVAEWRLVELV